MTQQDLRHATHAGVLLLDDEIEIHIDPVSMEGLGFGDLRIGQRVTFDVVEEDGKELDRTLRHITLD